MTDHTDPAESASDRSEPTDHDVYERERIEANQRHEEERKAEHEAAEARRKAAKEEAEIQRRQRRRSDS